MKTRLRRTATGLYGIAPPPVPRYHAFFTGGDLVASIYSSAGGWIEDRGSISLSPDLMPDGRNAILIRSDTGGFVGDNSLAWRSGAAELSVWDVEGEASFTYTATEGAFLSAPIYSGGFLWWFEAPASGVDFLWPMWLMRARCDLASLTVETRESLIANAALDSLDFESDSMRIAATPLHLIGTSFGFDSINHEVDGGVIARCSFDGEDADAYAWGDAESGSRVQLGTWLGLPSVTGTILGIPHNGSTLAKVLDDVDDLSTLAHWPTADAWALATGRNCGLSTSGAVATLYGMRDGVPTLIEASAEATAGEPTLVVAIADHPDLETSPALLYTLA